MNIILSQICTDIQDICETTFTQDQMNMFIRQAEYKIYTTVHFPNASYRVSLTADIYDPMVYVPAGCLYINSVVVQVSIEGTEDVQNITLINKDDNFITEAFPTYILGVPKYYSIFGASEDPSSFCLRLGPTPDNIYGVLLSYYGYPPSIVTLDNSESTTYLGDNFYPALLNGALVEALRFMKGEADLVQLYDKLYVQSIGLLKNTLDGKQRGDTYRNGLVHTKAS